MSEIFSQPSGSVSALLISVLVFDMLWLRPNSQLCYRTHIVCIRHSIFVMLPFPPLTTLFSTRFFISECTFYCNGHRTECRLLRTKVQSQQARCGRLYSWALKLQVLSVQTGWFKCVARVNTTYSTQAEGYSVTAGVRVTRLSWLGMENIASSGVTLCHLSIFTIYTF